MKRFLPSEIWTDILQFSTHLFLDSVMCIVNRRLCELINDSSKLRLRRFDTVVVYFMDPRVLLEVHDAKDDLISAVQKSERP